ncbi:MAG: TauD/TfdA family dioxygenase [Pseudomonadota bacterium]
MPERLVASPAAWRGAEIAAQNNWRHVISADHINEINAAIAHAKNIGKPTNALVRDDFPLPSLAGDIARWRDDIQNGRGFQVVSGIPVQDWGEADASLFFWCLGLHLGQPGAQNQTGDLLGHVRDTGADKSNPFVRQYMTTQNIPFHCDAADIVGLLCLNKAKAGGQSRIASSVTVYNEIIRRRPDLAPRLFDPFMLDVREERNDDGLKFIPIPPCRFDGTVLRTFYHAEYFRTVQRHDGVTLSEEDTALLDLYDEIAGEPGVHFDMDLEPGDIQLLSNHTAIHARTDYEDFEDPAKKRHLLRLWLSVIA